VFTKYLKIWLLFLAFSLLPVAAIAKDVQPMETISVAELQNRGYYHEFTVKTPGARNRGARRIVAGGNWATSREYYYTDNHYASFKRIIE
jgi:guanyl-specific ribonuclease Sa